MFNLWTVDYLADHRVTLPFSNARQAPLNPVLQHPDARSRLPGIARRGIFYGEVRMTTAERMRKYRARKRLIAAIEKAVQEGVNVHAIVREIEDSSARAIAACNADRRYDTEPAHV